MICSRLFLLNSKEAVAESVFSRLSADKVVPLADFTGNTDLLFVPKDKLERQDFFRKVRYGVVFKKLTDLTYSFDITGRSSDFWIFSLAPVFNLVGRPCFISVGVTFTVDAHVAVTLARDDGTSYDGVGERFWFKAGETKNVRLDYNFNIHHDRIKIQLQILKCSLDKGVLEFSHIHFSERVDFFVSRYPVSPTVVEANRAFAEFRYYDSMMLNLSLYKKYNLFFYKFNVERSVRKLCGRFSDFPVDLLIK